MYHILFISGQEILIIALVVLLLFGSKKIPDMARGLGKGLREFKKAADDIKREINESTPEVKKEINELGKDIKKSAEDLMDDIKNFKDDVQG
jgi:sec-independent protein translocase protein TatA